MAIGTVEPRQDSIERAHMKQVPDAPLPITPFDWRVWDSGALLGAPGTDDLGIVAGTLGTNVFTVQAGDVKTLTGTRFAIARRFLPDYYHDGQSVTVRLLAGMETTIAGTSCDIDVECYKVGDDGLASADLCTTAAQSMNSLTEGNKDFTITTTGLVAGDELEIRVAIDFVDAATVSAVTPVIYKSRILFDAKG